MRKNQRFLINSIFHRSNQFLKCQKIEPKFVSELALASLVVIAAAAAAVASQAFLKDQIEPRYDQEVRLSLVLSWYSRPEPRAKISFFLKCYFI